MPDIRFIEENLGNLTASSSRTRMRIITVRCTTVAEAEGAGLDDAVRGRCVKRMPSEFNARRSR